MKIIATALAIVLLAGCGGFLYRSVTMRTIDPPPCEQPEEEKTRE